MTNPQEFDVNSPLWSDRREQMFNRMVERVNNRQPFTEEDFKENLRICGAPEWVIEQATVTRDHGVISIKMPVWDTET